MQAFLVSTENNLVDVQENPPARRARTLTGAAVGTLRRNIIGDARGVVIPAYLAAIEGGGPAAMLLASGVAGAQLRWGCIGSDGDILRALLAEEAEQHALVVQSVLLREGCSFADMLAALERAVPPAAELQDPVLVVCALHASRLVRARLEEQGVYLEEVFPARLLAQQVPPVLQR